MKIKAVQLIAQALLPKLARTALRAKRATVDNVVKPAARRVGHLVAGVLITHVPTLATQEQQIAMLVASVIVASIDYALSYLERSKR